MAALKFICTCQNCGVTYGVTVNSFSEWFNLERVHYCELSA